MNRKHFAALGTSVALVAALTACSSGDAEEPATDDQTSSNAEADASGEGGLSNEAGGDTAEEPAEEGADAGAGTGASSDVEIIIDGETVEIADPSVQCGATGDTFAISLTTDAADAANADSFGALLTTGDNPEVTSVALSRSEGVSVAYVGGTDGSAEVTVDGKTYVITGEAMGVDLANPTGTDMVEFSFTVTCP